MPGDPQMDDASLAVFLGLTEEEAAIAIPCLTPQKRALYERMTDVCADLNMGIVPDGVIVCREKGHRNAR
jgi:hypothetical protein